MPGKQRLGPVATLAVRHPLKVAPHRGRLGVRAPRYPGRFGRRGGTDSLRPLDTLSAIAVPIILGLNFVAIRAGVEQVPPLLLTGLRFLFAAIPAILFIRPPRAPAGVVVAFGLTLGVIQFGLLFSAIGLGMPAGLASLVLQAQVFLTVAFSVALFHERPRRMQIVGASIGACGIAVIAWWRARGAAVLPFSMVIGAAAAWSAANLLAKRAGRVNMLSFMVWASVAAPLPLFALSWMFEDRTAIMRALYNPTLKSMEAVAFLAYSTTLLAFSLWNRLLARYPAATVAPYALLVPVVGIASTRVAFGEEISVVEIMGGFLVLAGLLMNGLGASPPR